jgi:hypothetical protein
MANTLATTGKEQRDQAGFPVEMGLKQAQTAEALANAQAKVNPPAETAVNPTTGAYYNPKGPPPAAALSSNNGALDNVVQQLIQSESAGNATARNPNSSATGAGQFLSGTWAPLIARLHPDLVAGKTPQQVLDLRNNPQLAAEATAAYAQDNAQALSQANLPVNGATIAMAHRLGPQGAQAVLSAQANAPLSSVLPAEVIKANPQYAKMTAGQLGQQLARQFGTTSLDVTPGDPNASGEDFLRTLPPARAAQIRAIANGDLPLPTGRAAASGPGQFLAQQVLQYDPTASTINLQTRQATRKAFTSGTQGQSIVQAVVGPLDRLRGLRLHQHQVAVGLRARVGQGVMQRGLTERLLLQLHLDLMRDQRLLRAQRLFVLQGVKRGRDGRRRVQKRRKIDRAIHQNTRLPGSMVGPPPKLPPKLELVMPGMAVTPPLLMPRPFRTEELPKAEGMPAIVFAKSLFALADPIMPSPCA